jgi:hypothetical protein
LPFSSYDGDQAMTAKLNYPHLGNITDSSTKLLFEPCVAHLAVAFTDNPKRKFDD